jgi:citrate lyase subunit beta/citryl-CoA lyase
MRSLLIAPGDETKLQAALESGADAVVIDLFVPSDARAAARAGVLRTLSAIGVRAAAPALMIQVSPLGDDETDLDLQTVMPSAPSAIVLPRALGGASVQELSAKLAVHEALAGLADGTTGIIAVADTAEALLEIASFRGASARLIGLGWDAAGLRQDIGAGSPRDHDGGYRNPYRLARDLTLLGAVAAGARPIDTAFAGADPEALKAEALAARRDGFSAKFALDAAQARIINEAFAD